MSDIPAVQRLENIILPSLVHAALRTINNDLLNGGISAREVQWWRHAANWFPHLREHRDILALRDALPPELRKGTPCEPQILVAGPSDEDAKLVPHIDREPDWAAGRKYARIAGVPLTTQTRENGAMAHWSRHWGAWPSSFNEPLFAEANPGDVIVMAPDVSHSSGINREGSLRVIVYFRFLEA